MRWFGGTVLECVRVTSTSAVPLSIASACFVLWLDVALTDDTIESVHFFGYDKECLLSSMGNVTTYEM